MQDHTPKMDHTPYSVIGHRSGKPDRNYWGTALPTIFLMIKKLILLDTMIKNSEVDEASDIIGVDEETDEED